MSTTTDTNGVFREVIVRLEEDGVFDRDAFYDMVDEVLEEKRMNGQLTDDDDIEQMSEEIKTRWPEAEASFSTGHDAEITEEE